MHHLSLSFVFVPSHLVSKRCSPLFGFFLHFCHEVTFVPFIRVPSGFARLRRTLDNSCSKTHFKSTSLDFGTTTSLPNSCRSAFTDTRALCLESLTVTAFWAVVNGLSFVLDVAEKVYFLFNQSFFLTKFFISKSPFDFASSSSAEIFSAKTVQVQI